jgi:L-ascorbate metabolism protein UlaG (beta-lactamase superfamily)
MSFRVKQFFVIICSIVFALVIRSGSCVLCSSIDLSQENKTAVEKTSKGDLKITPIIHSSIMFQFDDMVIYVDPIARADYSNFPRADIILITHHHGDHLDVDLINKLKKPDTSIIASEACGEKLSDYIVMKNGDKKEIRGLQIEAIPAYNLVRERRPGEKFHPRGEGNGYIITFADKRVYIAGDTECIPEMKGLKDIDIAFIPINLPYTMPPEEAAECIKHFHPRIVYPYHQGKSDPQIVADLLKGEKDIEVRVLELP